MKKKNYATDDLEITFKYVKVKVHVADDIFDDEQLDDLKRAVEIFSREIVIDKTYVAYEGSKYTKRFLTEYGWKDLCNLLKKTKFGKKANLEQHQIIQTSYSLMIVCYLYMCLNDIGYDSDGIYLEIPTPSMFMVQIQTDTYREYARYPGKWQTWNSIQ